MKTPNEIAQQIAAVVIDASLNDADARLNDVKEIFTFDKISNQFEIEHDDGSCFLVTVTPYD